MEPRPLDLGDDESVARALATARTAAFVLRDLDFDALDELDQDAVARWEAEIGEARATLARMLLERRCEELEAPPRGQLDRYDEARVKRHVQGISKAILSELERVGIAPPSAGQVSTSIILGLLYSLRGIEQFILWQDARARSRARSRAAADATARPDQRADSPSSQVPEPTGAAADEGAEGAHAAPGSTFTAASTDPASGSSPDPDSRSDSRSSPVSHSGAVPHADPGDYAGAYGSADALEKAFAEALSLPGLSGEAGPDPATYAERDADATDASKRATRKSRLPDLGSWTQPAAEGEPPPLPALPEPPPAPTPAPERPRRGRRRPVDINAYYDSPDESGAALRVPPLSVFHAITRGPALAKRETCLDATSVRSVPAGVAFALADGTESSIGARVAAIAATTKFCEYLDAEREGLTDARAAILTAVEGTRRQLEMLVESLIDCDDESDTITRLRGALPVATVRRILEHTLRPEPGLKHVTPALAVSFVGGLIVQTAELTHELTVLAVGPAVVERKQRGRLAEVLLPAQATERFAPGAASPWTPASFRIRGPVELKGGDVFLAGCSALRRGHDGPALEKLSQLAPDIAMLTSPRDDHALQLLLQAAAAADRFEALEEKRLRARPDEVQAHKRPPLFADDLSMVLATIAGRAKSSTIAPPPGTSAPHERA